MDWQTKMNKAVSYIEENLTGEIKSEVIAKMIGYSAWEFQRMFSFVTDTSLGEYIRSRRLAIAAYDIQTSDKKIIDIALKYGYDSSAAFSRAFSRQFGISPSSARNEGVKLEPYPKITFPTKKEGGIIMSIEKTFDNLSDEIIKPGDVYDRIEDEIENLPEVALVTFKSEFIDVIKSRPDMEIVTDKLAINDCDNNV
ncbi:MAG: helix-turn-helix domain-containing protein, partial [Firmicutes bacterium]|nr:helix-turn-helix domain-containing protein [Bacillota bacterium]